MKHIGPIAAVFLALGAAIALAGPPNEATAGSSSTCRRGMAIHDAGLVQIGGIRQWVTIQGEDCANPVVLMVHGGPGNPSTRYADNVFRGWTKEFTLVQWDQRGSGKTFEASPPATGEHLTVERLTQDGLDVARYAAHRLAKRKVILMGGSWGSALAVNMLHRQPHLFSAYVGSAQLVSYQEDMRTSYEQVLKLARAAGDSDSVAKVEALGPPPWTNPRNFGILRRVTRRYEAQKSDPPPSDWYEKPAAGYDTPAYEATYHAGEDYSYLEFVGLNGDGMGPGIDLRKLGMRFAVPVYMLQGEADLVTPPTVSKAYFDSLSAPYKQFIWLPRTGHDPNRTMIDAQLKVLKRLRPSAMAIDRNSTHQGSARAAPRKL